MMKQVKDFLFRPFKEHLLFMLFLFVTMYPYVWLQFFILKYNLNGVLLVINCFLLAYVVTLLVGLIKSKAVRTVIQVLLTLMMGTLFAWNIYCLVEFQGILDEDYLMLILETNVNEANEFLTSVVPLKVLLGVGGVFLCFAGLGLFSRRHHLGLGDKWSIPVLLMLALLFCVNLKYWQIWKDGPITHVARLVTAIPKYDLPDNYQLNNTHPEVTFLTGNEAPENVVLIIGESFARCHSSMYGYDKQTNPRLGALRDSSLLFTFDSIDAPASMTSQAFRFLMSLYSMPDSLDESINWYDRPNLMELMRASGYDSYWFSNQASTGRFNYIARVFAQSCDHVKFYQVEGPIGNNRVMDNVLVDSSQACVSQLGSGRHFVVYHMMGSHFEYRMRYPDEFSRFTVNDYPDRKAHQRYILSTYDNSILYNDYIVEQLINLFRDRETVVVYMPDHGQDVYQSAPDYCLHGKTNDPVSFAYGVKIPFMVYATPLFQQRHPGLMQRIKDRQEHPKPWNTDDLPYFIMDLIGVETVNGENVQSRSVLD